MMIVQNTQERVSEQTEIEFRQLALKSLVSLRNKQLQESLDHRIKRAVKVGAWIGLTLSACRSLHNQEKARLREQLAEFQFKQAYMKEKLTEARKAVARARRLRASQQTATRKGRSSLS
jgi:predicted anti-sigma-YlaC factor YlaD